MSTIRPSTVLATTAGVGIAAFLGYALYFDHRRRSDPEFRKALKRESKREARIAKDQAHLKQKEQKDAIGAMIAEIQNDGFPEGNEEKEEYFMQMVSEGEALSQQGDNLSAAACFYKALKVYPAPHDLAAIYDKTVPREVLNVLADFIAADGTIPIAGTKSSTGTGSVKSGGDSAHGVDD